MLRAPAAMIQEGSRVPGCRVGDGGSDLMMMTVVTIKYIVIYIYIYISLISLIWGTGSHVGRSPSWVQTCTRTTEKVN